MPFAHVHEIDIWYELSKPRQTDGPLLVLTHGFAGPHWPPMVDEFRTRFRLLDYHVRGHGRTGGADDPSHYSVPQFAADLAGLLDALDIERAHVGGVSMGGIISAQFACDYPSRLQSLLLCDTTAGNGDGDDAAAGAERQLRDAFSTMARIVEKHGLAELVARENRYRRERDPFASTRDVSMEGQDEENRRKLAAMTEVAYLHVNRALRERPDLTGRTPAITVPTLISCGEWDMFYPCALRDHRLIASSRLATIRRAAHATPDYQPDLWKQAIFDFIDDVEAGRDVRGEVEYERSVAQTG